MWIRDSERFPPRYCTLTWSQSPSNVTCSWHNNHMYYFLSCLKETRKHHPWKVSRSLFLFTSEMRKSFCFYSSSINSLLTGWASCHKEQLPVHGVTSACNLCSHAQWSPPLSAWIDNFCSSIQAAKNNITPQPQCTSDEIQLYLFPWWWITLER